MGWEQREFGYSAPSVQGDKRHQCLRSFHPLVADWFQERFDVPTKAQELGWPVIASGRDALIAAPTGAGKTLAAFLVCIDELVRRGLESELESGIDVLYVSPLKALSNDVARNLEQPLAELSARALREGMRFPDIKVAVRTGDTPAAERARMRKHPPNILVTTPESLFILLTADKSRRALSRVRTVIVDEIHAIATDKRGAHLSVSLERLDRLVLQAGGRQPTRIGVSATQSPIERIARFLVGTRRELPVIADAGCRRDIDVAIEITDDELGAVASNEQCERVYDRIAELIGQHETTLVFVNTRRLVERVARALEERLGEDQVVAHHGSLSRKIRFAAEQKLKTGTVKCAVATASLELGIDVGTVDLVVQLGSPRAISTVVQRIGRSGHSLGKTPKGRLFALTRDQLVECAALVRAVRKGRLDRIRLREKPRDILAQHAIAACACEDLDEDELYQLVTGAAHYAELPRDELEAILEVLSEGISTIRGRRGAHLHRDRVNQVVKARRGARLAAITCGGAIPDNASYQVVTFPDETPVGSLDEDFAIESSAGDVFLLGNTSWRIHKIESTRVLVEDAAGMAPTIPFWFGEAPARTRELSEEVSFLRAEIDEMIAAGHEIESMAQWAAAECHLSREAAVQMVSYLWASKQALGAMPTTDRLIAERFFDDAGGMQLVIHSPLGGRINKAWGLALRKRFCRSFNFELQAAATDDGLIISLGPPHSFPLETVFDFLTPQTARKVLEQAVLDSPAFGVRWRWTSTRSLAVLRRYGGKKVPPNLLRMRTDDLLTVVFPMAQACLENVVGDIEIPDHPLVNETMDDCLSDFMDAQAFVDLVARIRARDIEVVAVETTEPSPLSHEIINANPYAFLDDVPLEERRTRAVSVPRGIRLEDRQRVIDDRAIEQASAEALPAIRNADELHDLLLSLGAARPSDEWRALFDELVAAGRATCWSRARSRLWIATERVPVVSQALPGGVAEPKVIDLGGDVPTAEQAMERIVRGHLELGGPIACAQLADRLGAEAEAVEAALRTLENQGAIIQGQFSSSANNHGDTEWVDRRVLARIHRIAIGRLRRAVEPVDGAALMRFLLRWQRLAPAAQAMGEDGLATVIEQLQG
ncbi:MAG: DEAD/DEAH box helicase, partial [Deltaproteobacteria bacterium]|nr:DEAD/DEAH box helicase [Deltaproteobacteria bacterium]